ncbi:hypothetical protein ABZP36_025764 [Zizania latifolia]
MEAIEELADAARQASILLADDDPSEHRAQGRGSSSFLTVVALGNIVRTRPPPRRTASVLSPLAAAPFYAVLMGIAIRVCAGRGEIGSAKWLDRPSRSREYKIFQ